MLHNHSCKALVLNNPKSSLAASTRTNKVTSEIEGVPIAALRALKCLSSEERRIFVHLVEAEQLRQLNSDAECELLRVSKGLLHICQQLPHPGDVVGQYKAMQGGLDAVQRRRPPSMTTSLSWMHPFGRLQLGELERFLSYHFVFFVQDCSRAKVACSRFNGHGVLDYLVEPAHRELQTYKGKVVRAWKTASTFIRTQQVSLSPDQELNAASLAQLQYHTNAFLDTLSRMQQRLNECLDAFYSHCVACNLGKRVGYEARANLARVAGPKMRFYDAIEQIKGPYGTSQILSALLKLGITRLDADHINTYLRKLESVDQVRFKKMEKKWEEKKREYQRTGFGRLPEEPTRLFFKPKGQRFWELEEKAFHVVLKYILWREKHDPLKPRDYQRK